ncbi:hypothetical protein Syun_006227 [Stephania yunnanensis]|uniref:CRAL/TRIO N-terminal domain-containing protein n=1 Tax=Stephania yunnanensis TaxID=152371 RepID=A0AAP0KWI6_9MAGN
MANALSVIPTTVLRNLSDKLYEKRKNAAQENVHQGYPPQTLVRFLKAREWSVPKAHKMLMDCLNWRIQNEIDNILAKPIIPTDIYRAVRDSQLLGLSGFSKEGVPVFAIGVARAHLIKLGSTTMFNHISR